MIEKIEITKEYWDYSDKIRYKYISPERTLWNVSKVTDLHVHIWAVNAWGEVYRTMVDIDEFMSTWYLNEE